MLKRIFEKVLKVWWGITVPLRLRMIGVEIGKGARFFGMPIVSMAPRTSIKIGERVVLCSDSRFTALGVNHPVVLRTMRPGAEIAIGADTGISGGTICAAVRISIGKECMFGANVTIGDTDFHAVKPEGRRFNNREDDIECKEVVIGDNVFIGVQSLVLKGVTIGDNSIVGGGSVVVKTVPPNTIVAGNPARTIGTL